MAHIDPHLPFELRAYDPNFARKIQSWAFEMTCQMHELILKTQETNDATRTLMADVDRALAGRLLR